MNQDILHFSHANGFPAESYKTLFKALSTDFEIGHIDRLAHNPNYPVTDSWPHLVDELIDYLDRTYDRPVIAVGHSMGGVLSYMAALKRPELFKAFIMLDAPLLLGFDRLFMQTAKRLGFVDRVTPAARTIGRCEWWPDFETAVNYFKGKGLFRYMDQRCIEDYVRYGTEPSKDGLSLRYSAATEVELYRTLPHGLGKGLAKSQVPGAFIYGRQSRVVWPYQIRMVRNKAGVYATGMDGSHMFPLEHPEKTAQTIRATIEKLETWQN